MIGYYNYTVWLTFVGMLSSVTGIGFAFAGNADAAVICLMVSGLCDVFDGIVARTKKNRSDEEKRFGIQLDSLSDIVCFGILPFAIGLCIGADKWWQTAIMALFALAGLIRLAYFNVSEETRQQQTSEKRKHYKGVPITSTALSVPLLFCFRGLLGASFPLCYTLLLLVNGALFITPVQVKKPTGGTIVLMVCLGAVFTAIILFFG